MDISKAKKHVKELKKSNGDQRPAMISFVVYLMNGRVIISCSVKSPCGVLIMITMHLKKTNKKTYSVLPDSIKTESKVLAIS